MRVVSLLPSATEIVAALGGVDRLVGVTHECDHPPAVTGLPRVTACTVDGTAAPGAIDAAVRAITSEGRALYSLNEAVIRALRPDLILTQALCEVCAVTEDDVRAFAARLSPTPQVLTLSATSLDGVFDDIARVGRALAIGDEADELLAGLRERLRRVHRTLEAARAPRPRVAVLEWSDPAFAAGHWVPEMVHRAGGTEVLGRRGEPSRTVTIEAIAAADPAIVLVAPCGYSLARASAEATRLMTDHAWRVLAAREVWALDANAITSRPGPHLVDGVEVMARIFNPALFSPLDASRAVAVRLPAGAPIAG